MFSQLSRPTWHQALGEYFFYRMDQQLSSALKTQQQLDAQRETLANAIGSNDRELIDNLVNAGFEESNFEAIQLLPCVAVAWADGFVLPGEVEALRQASEVFGIAAGSAAEAVCRSWLAQRPDDSLFQLWAQYIRSTSVLQTPFLRRAMAREIIEHAELVAKAAGGFFGIAAISQEERQVLSHVRTVLADSTDVSRFVA
ncbi:MAG TPA: hypothetical protein DDZ51_00615 [Planctomycetaceae bacterium]|nr:hypothetical protein [Planctomycetaceae bacterium]